MGCKIYPKIDTLFTRDEKFKVTDEIRRPEFRIPSEWLVTEKIHGTNIRVSLEEEYPPLMNFGDTSGSLSNNFVPVESAKWVMRINGRNDNSQIPPNLLRHLQDTFTLKGLKSLWRCKNSCGTCDGVGSIPIEEGLTDPNDMVRCPDLDLYPITLYGEGYGGGIQKGGHEYTSKTKGGAVSFRLFDVLVGTTWLRRADVEDVAAKLGVKTVPLLSVDERGTLTVAEITQLAKAGFASSVAGIEGTEWHPAEGIVAFTAEPLYNNRGQRLMFKLKGEDFS